MRAGRLQHQITILSPVESSDGMGGRTVTWAESSAVWAEVLPMVPAGENALAGEEAVTHKITIRHDSALSLGLKSRVKFGTRTFLVRAVEYKRERQIDAIIWATEVL